MKLKKSTIKELKTILDEEYKLKLSDTDLEQLAYSLVGYFNGLLKSTEKR